MQVRSMIAALTGCLLLAGTAAAQTIPGDVTFEVPINLTRLAADITKIDVTCTISSDAITATRVVRGVTNAGKLVGNVVLPVTKGRVVTTANVVVTVAPGALQDPYGKYSAATYECMLTGYSAGTAGRRTGGGLPAGWGVFEESSARPSFRLSPTPQRLTGSFNW
jgi:hypothetical protein